MGGLADLKSYGEPGAMVYLADCVDLMRLMPASCVDAVFADPPYRLSTGRGVTVKSGRLVPVDKGSWEHSLGSFEADHAWNVRSGQRPLPWARNEKVPRHLRQHEHRPN